MRFIWVHQGKVDLPKPLAMNLPAGGRIKRAWRASLIPAKTIRFWNGAGVDPVSPRGFPALAAAHPGAAQPLVVAAVPTRSSVYDKLVSRLRSAGTLPARL